MCNSLSLSQKLKYMKEKRSVNNEKKNSREMPRKADSDTLLYSLPDMLRYKDMPNVDQHQSRRSQTSDSASNT